MCITKKQVAFENEYNNNNFEYNYDDDFGMYNENNNNNNDDWDKTNDEFEDNNDDFGVNYDDEALNEAEQLNKIDNNEIKVNDYENPQNTVISHFKCPTCDTHYFNPINNICISCANKRELSRYERDNTGEIIKMDIIKKMDNYKGHKAIILVSGYLRDIFKSNSTQLIKKFDNNYHGIDSYQIERYMSFIGASPVQSDFKWSNLFIKDLMEMMAKWLIIENIDQFSRKSSSNNSNIILDELTQTVHVTQTSLSHEYIFGTKMVSNTHGNLFEWKLRTNSANIEIGFNTTKSDNESNKIFKVNMQLNLSLGKKIINTKNGDDITLTIDIENKQFIILHNKKEFKQIMKDDELGLEYNLFVGLKDEGTKVEMIEFNSKKK